MPTSYTSGSPWYEHSSYEYDYTMESLRSGLGTTGILSYDEVARRRACTFCSRYGLLRNESGIQPWT